ncbi:MAG TPA: HD domain-containing protein [Thermoanaerobaculia bacterium]|nr:HD domain-containing protein [Thermoanaerobaculia bacterium]
MADPRPKTAGGTDRLGAQIQFILEIDKLKSVLRRTWILDRSRRENSAEHSWHLAVMAVLLAEYGPPGLDLTRVLKMVLVHDLVEIDAGDTFCYDQTAVLDQNERERRAADRLFALLPQDLAAELRGLWEEFDARASPDARFAAALDRLQPVLHNYTTGGGTWREHSVTRDQVVARNQPMGDGAPDLWEYAKSLIDDAVARGLIES